jgi:hypothetical protein
MTEAPMTNASRPTALAPTPQPALAGNGAWEGRAMSGRARRHAVRAALVSVLFIRLGAGSGVAAASEAGDAIAEARADLQASPAERGAARAALDRAVRVGGDPGAVAEAHFRLATLDEEEGALARALDEDRAAVVTAPGSRWARSAGARASWLTARSEGAFVPLVRLMTVWRDRDAAGDEEVVQALANDAEAFPPGVVRGEARMFVADAWLHRLHRPEDAKRELARVRDDPSGDAQSITFASRELAEELVAEGALDAAIAELGAHPSRFEPAFAGQVRRLRLRRRLGRVAAVELAAYAVLVAMTVLRAWRTSRLALALRPLLRPAALAIQVGGCVIGVGALVLLVRSAGPGVPVVALGVAALPVLVAASVWQAVGSRSRLATIARSSLAGVSLVALAFLVVACLRPAVLDRLGV